VGCWVRRDERMKKMVILLGCVCVWVGGLCVLVLVVMVLLMYATQRFFFQNFRFFCVGGEISLEEAGAVYI